MELLEICDKTATLPHEIKSMIFKYMSHTTADLIKQFNEELTEGIAKTARLSWKAENFKKILEETPHTPLPKGFTGGYFLVDDTIWGQSEDVLYHKYTSATNFLLNKIDPKYVTINIKDYQNKLYGTILLHPSIWDKQPTINDYRKIAEQNNIKIKKKIKKKDLITALIKGG